MSYTKYCIGMGLVEGYNEIGLQVSLAKPQLRADFERDLKAICDGRKQAAAVRREQIDVYREVFRQVAQRIARLDAMVGSRLGAGGGANNEGPGRPGLGPGGGGNDPPRPGGGGPAGRGGGDSDNDDQPPSNHPSNRTPFLNNLPPPTTTVAASKQRTSKKQLSSTSSNDSSNKISLKTKCPPLQNNRSLSSTAINSTISNNSFNENSTFPMNGEMKIKKSNCDSSLTSTSGTKTLKVSTLGTATNSIKSNSTERKNGLNSSINSPQPSTSRCDDINRLETEPRHSVIHSELIDKFDDLGNRMEFLAPLPEEFQCPSETVGQVTFVLHDQQVVLRARTEYDDQVVCHCGQSAQLLTVRKEGANKGRPFYRCGGAGQCDMFLWESGDIDAGNVAVLAPSGDVDVVDRADSQEVRCNCHQPATLRTVSKAGSNTGRQFYGCPKPIGQGCKFFQWADDMDNAITARPSTTGRGSRRGGRGGWKGRGAKRIEISKKASRTKTKCSNCQQQGHTKKTCKK